MAVDTKVLEHLATNIRGSFARLNHQMVFANGYNRPRYFDRQGKAGYLGLEGWTAAEYTPTGVASAGGSLTEGLYYSCVAIPVDTHYADSFGNYRRGTPTTASAGVLTTAANKTITWTIPLAHPQLSLNMYTGATLTGGTNAQSNFATWGSVVDGHFAITIDGTARNITVDFTGVASMDDVAAKIQSAIRAATSRYETVVWATNRFIIRSSLTSSESAITVTSTYAGGTDISGAGASDWMDCDAGHGVVTAASKNYEADEVWLYCSQGQTTPELAQAAAKYYIGKVNNAAMSTFVLSVDPSPLNDAVETDNLPPPTLRHIVSLQDRLWGIVGITESRGTVKWNPLTSRFEGKTYGPFTITAITSQGNDVWRVAFSGSPDLSEVTMQMRMSVSGCSVPGNNITLATIVSISDTGDYIDIRNENGASTGTFGTGTVYSTHFADGMVDMKFRFEMDGVNQLYSIASVDPDGQTFTVAETTYNGTKTPGEFYNFFIEGSDRTLWWSKVDDPNSWPTENTMQFEDDLTAISPSGEYLVVFSREHIFIVNPRNPTEFRKTNSPIGTYSPFSLVPSENGVYFFDGTTIRLFDGLQSNDITRRRVKDILDNVNKAVLDRVHGIYLPEEQCIRWYIPVGSSVTNNYYVQYNVPTGFWWIGQCMDCTCAMIMPDVTDGSVDLYTGTSARYASKGFILKHDRTKELDGTDPATTYYFGTVQTVDTTLREITFSVATGAVSTNEVGTPFTVFAYGGTRDLNAVIGSIFDNGGGVYTIGYHSDFDFSTAQAGDTVAIGIIPFVWGVKWDDFGSPQYKHELKEIHLHFTPTSYIYGIVDFYTDFKDTPDKSVSFTVQNGESKAVIRNHGKRGYQVGVRIRIWSYDAVEIRDQVWIHKTIV